MPTRVRIAATLASLLIACGAAPTTAEAQTPWTTYTGQVIGYLVHVLSGCDAPYTETNNYYKKPGDIPVIQTSCNGYSIVLNNIKVSSDPVTATKDKTGNWTISPPLNL